ncbi:alpha/beta-hydrolase [Mytilinidion resinicola]|uniref:Alpha/beta-hydrolase n=1 Tax=Mytilinidion resinicola TaxID=574789 RepID=A0A6A6YDF3_9PEZI|nr:alpha/beta-hydrolase [Mytilinidion resinicola]KAF2806750.1 alpha/beta-hydrolase [Mytilinidion resinicola]
MSRSTAHDARNVELRKAFVDPSVAQSVSIPTAVIIETRCKKNNVAWKVEDISNSSGARIHWIGDRSAQKAILWFHGGGFGLPLFDGHVIFLIECQKQLQTRGENVVIALLEYTLTTEAKYPTQYQQGAEALRHVLSKGYTARNVVMGGDSAGANLALAVISSIMHPHPDIKPLSLSGPLAGLLLNGPWVTFSTDAKSFQDNAAKDIHGVDGLHWFTRKFVNDDEKNNYTEPLGADISWWKDLPAKETIVLAGGHELFLTDDREFASKLKDAGVSVKYVECENEVHIDCFLDAQFGTDPGMMTFATWEWSVDVFSGVKGKL